MPVAFTSKGYDTTVDNPYTEASWAEAHPAIGSATYGVRSPLDWKVTAVAGQDRTVSINAGRGFGHGVTDKTVENDTLQLASITSGSRWDLIVARRDWTPTAGVTKFEKISGGATAAIPGGRLYGPGNIDDQPLALVQVTAGQTQPTAIIDLRTWTGDGGGLVANHDLVRSFLNQVGTHITINGVLWIRRVGANDVPEWANGNGLIYANSQTVGAGMTTNAFSSGTLRPLIQVGTFVGTTSDNGDLTITYPTQFPSGVIGGIGFSGDGVYIVSATPTSVAMPTTSSLFLRFANPNGSPVASKLVRGTWIAVGW